MPTVETPHGRVALFCKPQVLNLGIEASTGDVLTFLDCDAIVGGHWLTGAEWLASREGEDTTRLCYRVRLLPEESVDELDRKLTYGPSVRAEEKVTEWFKRYDEGNLFPRAHEGYASPEINSTGCWDSRLTFGNSQFSIRRKMLGNVRCDENYIGAGWEDLEFIRAIWRKTGDRYKGTIRTKPDEAMFHGFSVRESDWHNAEANMANKKRYRNS